MFSLRVSCQKVFFFGSCPIYATAYYIYITITQPGGLDTALCKYNTQKKNKKIIESIKI